MWHCLPSCCWYWGIKRYVPTSSKQQTAEYSIRDSCWPRILRSCVWDVTVCSSTGADVWGEGITSIRMASWLHTITPQQTVTHAIPTVLAVPFNVCSILIMVPLCLPQSRNTIAWFYLFLHTLLRYFYYQHMSLYIFFISLNYASSLPNAQIILHFSSKSMTYRNLMTPLRS